jgi:hypothetical protein
MHGYAADFNHSLPACCPHAPNLICSRSGGHQHLTTYMYDLPCPIFVPTNCPSPKVSVSVSVAHCARLFLFTLFALALFGFPFLLFVSLLITLLVNLNLSE